MPFITQGKTNWKFLLIVIVLAAVVVGFSWWLSKNIFIEGPLIKPTKPDEKYCEKDSDCVLNYTGSEICSSCSSDDYQCVSLEYYNKVLWPEWEKNHKGILCEGCPMVTEKIQCICEKSLCKKIIKDETADWKIYRNDKYGFEVKYPPAWKTLSDFPGRLSSGQTEFVEGVNPQSFLFAPISKDFTKNEADVILYVAPEGYFNCSSYANISNDSVNDFLKQNLAKDEIEFCKSNIYFRFSVTTDQKEIFNQILSTFKFIETSSSDFKVIGTDKETGWDIGRSDNYGFEIKYPSNNSILTEGYIGPSVVAYLKMINESDQTEGDLSILVTSATSSDKCDGPSQIYEVEGFPITSSALIGSVIFTRIDYYSDAIDLNRDYTTFRNGFCYKIHLVAYPYSCISSGCGDRRWSEVTFQAMLNNFNSIVNTFRFISQ